MRLKLLVVLLPFLAILAFGRCDDHVNRNNCSRNSTVAPLPPEVLKKLREYQFGADTPPPTGPNPDDIWNKAKCRGAALIRAMTLDEDESSRMLQWPYTQSPWDGDFEQELATWGYSEDEFASDFYCDFAEFQQMGRAFKDLKVNPNTVASGGSNHCFFVQHANGPTVPENDDGTQPEVKDQWYQVDGTWYRETDAYASMSINALDGMIVFISRKSPEEAAKKLWEVDAAPAAALPKLRSSSDSAWGFWKRVASKPPATVQGIKYIMSNYIENGDTANIIIPRALKIMGVEDQKVKPWLGMDVRVGWEGEEAEAAEALIGSANGLGGGYFLLQHKKQLGGAKFFYMVKIFLSDAPDDTKPNLLFYIDPNGPPEPPPESPPESPPGSAREGRSSLSRYGKRMLGEFQSSIVTWSADGKSTVREHLFRAKL